LLLQVFGEGVLYDLTPQEVTHQLKNLSVSVGKDKEKKKKKKKKKKPGGTKKTNETQKKKKKKKKKKSSHAHKVFCGRWPGIHTHTHTRISLFLNTI
jgi:sRNA-binding protein